MKILSSLTNALSGAFKAFGRKPDEWRIEVNDLEFQNSRFHTLSVKPDPRHPGNLCICLKAGTYRLLGAHGKKKNKIGRTENGENFYAHPYADAAIDLYGDVHERLAADPQACAILEMLDTRATAILDNIPPGAIQIALYSVAHTLFRQTIEENYRAGADTSSFGKEITIISSPYICVGLWRNGRRLVYDTANNLAHGTALHHTASLYDPMQKLADSRESRHRLTLAARMS